MNPICVLHDFFLYRWGGERLSLIIRESLNADLATGFIAEGSLGEQVLNSEFLVLNRGQQDTDLISWKTQSQKAKTRVFILGFAWNRGLLRYLRLKYYYLFKTGFLKNYPTVILAGDCLEAIWRIPSSTKSIIYVHNIPRYLFSHADMYLAKAKWYQRPAMWIAKYVLSRVYVTSLKRATKILANSARIHHELRDLTGRNDIEILYPCVDTDVFYPREEGKLGEYYLSYARLATLKRVDRIIEAFQKMPDKKLLVIHGRNDPQRSEWLALTKWYPNIECRILENNDDLPEVVRNAIAHIFIPENEEFGMNTIEASASGIPTIWAHDGGLLETIEDGVNGIFLSANPSAEEIIEAVQAMAPEKALSMREGCRENATRFSQEEFAKRLQEITH